MNYIRHLNGFFARLAEDKRMSSYHISLYFALFQQWNAERFADQFAISRSEMMQLSRIGSANTYARCIKELSDWGYISYTASSNLHSGSRVSCIGFDTASDTASNTGTDTGRNTGIENDTTDDTATDTGRNTSTSSDLINDTATDTARNTGIKNDTAGDTGTDNDEPKEKVNLKFTAYSKNLKQNLENLFTELNRMDFITSKQMYNDALKLFHVEIRQVQKGHLIFVTDGNGNPIRHPMKMSDFEDRPKFYLPEQKTLSQHFEKHPHFDLIEQSSGVFKSLILNELIRQVKTQFDDGSGLRNKRYKLKSQKNRAKRKL